MHLSPLRNSITSITTDLWRKICIVTKQNALFKEILNFLIDLRSVQIDLHKGVLKCFFSMSRHFVLVISRLFSSRIYKAARFFTHPERV